MTTLDQLRQLQALDSKIDTGRERIATIEALVSDRSEYESVRRDHQTKSAALKLVEAEQRDVDLQAGRARQQLVESEQRMYSGKIANPRELDDLRRRGDDLRHQITTLEERLFGLMEQVEDGSTATREAEERLKQIVTDHRTTEAALLEERKTLATEVRAAQAERDQLRPTIDASALHIYNQCGVGLAAWPWSACAPANVPGLPRQPDRVRRAAIGQGGDAVMICDSCGRILYDAS